MGEERSLIQFGGGVSCRWEGAPPVLTLAGRSADFPEEIASMMFYGAATENLPEALEDVVVQQIGAGVYRVCSGEQGWPISARSVHLHRDIAAAFYQAIPPRPVPLGKRIFWRVVLTLVSHPFGKKLLLALRR